MNDKKKPAHDASADDSILTMPLDALQSRVTQAMGLWKQILVLLPGGVVFTDNERLRTQGRLRDGEEAQLLTVLDVTEAFPALFEGLADLDEGADPTRFEPKLLRDRLQRAAILAPFVDSLAYPAEHSLGDTVLHLRALARGPLSEAYGIAKAMARSNLKLKTLLAPVMDFYRSLAVMAAAARKVNQAKKA